MCTPASLLKLKEKSEQYAFTNGIYFKIDLRRSKIDGDVVSECLLFKSPTPVYIKGKFDDSGKFTKHMAVSLNIEFT